MAGQPSSIQRTDVHMPTLWSPTESFHNFLYLFTGILKLGLCLFFAMTCKNYHYHYTLQRTLYTTRRILYTTRRIPVTSETQCTGNKFSAGLPAIKRVYNSNASLITNKGVTIKHNKHTLNSGLTLNSGFINTICVLSFRFSTIQNINIYYWP